MFQMAEKCALKFFSKWLILSKSDSKQRIMVSNSSQVTYLQKITLIRQITGYEWIDCVLMSKEGSLGKMVCCQQGQLAGQQLTIIPYLWYNLSFLIAFSSTSIRRTVAVLVFVFWFISHWLSFFACKIGVCCLVSHRVSYVVGKVAVLHFLIHFRFARSTIICDLC